MKNLNIKLQRCKRTDTNYQEIRNRHYVANRGTHGQQIHYLILFEEEIVGIISGASSVWAVKARDEYFGLNKQNKQAALPSIINNTVFRLEKHIPNLATFVLAIWRKQIALDWEERYKVKVHGFETFVIETDYRKGTLYKADNWEYLGETAGSTKSHVGLENKSKRKATEKKMIYAKKIPKTKLSTYYESTWNKKKKPADTSACHRSTS